MAEDDDLYAWKGTLWPSEPSSANEMNDMLAVFKELQRDPTSAAELQAGLDELRRRENEPIIAETLTPEAHAGLAMTHLRERQQRIDPGLSDGELAAIDDALGVRLPDEMRVFLSAGVPVGQRWPAWREPKVVAANIREDIDHVFTFDIEHNAYWNDAFGPRPDDVTAAVANALAVVRTWPVLFPVESHRYMCVEPGSAVISLAQAVDSIWWARDLDHLLWQLAAVPVRKADEDDGWSFPQVWIDAFDLDGTD